ncbi:MAG: YlmC/YmxH family sporulation protein [Oscillospiraceae bacterium]|nr:YlmC/YmxH family sporulation protein [Oscillospiraceae bacterium]
MICSFSELRKKEVIDINTGDKLGYVDDIELDTDSSKVLALIIYGRSGLFWLWSKEPDIVIQCSEIKVIGRDTILVSPANISEKVKKLYYNASSTKNKKASFVNL